MANGNSHPDAVVLHDYALGRLDDADCLPLEEHLSACDSCQETLDAPSADPLLTLLQRAGRPALPQLRLQRGYEILGEIGRGGMGVVYQARQVGLNRLVALKMISAQRQSDAATLARFRREAEAAARLQHPHIVQIFEAGEQDGVPYLALELVQGMSLAERLSSGPLPHREAATLLATVARAVDFAHQHGVLHRDLKPANILCHGDVPKIADFGLARLLDATGPTETGTILGSPLYMSPEQAAGVSQPGPATDIYALGAILYECLTGRPPFQAATALQAIDLVRTTDPVLPRQLQPHLAVDLQTICLKCLQKDAAKRYRSAGELANDLDRYLAGQPIQARPTSQSERVLRWVRRHPTWTTLLSLIAVLPVVAWIALVLHLNSLQALLERVDTARKRADRNYVEAKATIGRMLDVLASAPLTQVPALTEMHARQAEDALRFFEQTLADDETADAGLRLDTAHALQRTAQLQTLLGNGKEARELCLRALTLIDRLRHDADSPALRIEEANCCNSIGVLHLGQADPVGAEKFLQRGLAGFEGILENDPKNMDAAQGAASCHHGLGNVYHWQNRPESEQHYRLAAELHRGLVQRAVDNNVHRFNAIGSLSNLLLLYAFTQRPELARQTMADIEQLAAPLLADVQAGPRARLRLAPPLQSLAEMHRQQKDFATALSLCQRGLDFVQPVLANEPNLDDARSFAMKLYGTRALIHGDMGRYTESLPDWDKVVELSPPDKKNENRLRRAIFTVHAGRVEVAIAEADALAPLLTTDGDSYNLACIYALAAKQTPPGHAARQAIEILSRLKKAGFFQDKNAKLLAEDPDLAALRLHMDFAKLLQDS